MADESLERDVLQILRKFRYGSGTPTVHNAQVLAPILSCWKYGHPSQPRPKRKYQNWPWRCERCGCWYSVEWKESDAPEKIPGSWVWVRVAPRKEVAPE